MTGYGQKTLKRLLLKFLLVHVINDYFREQTFQLRCWITGTMTIPNNPITHTPSTQASTLNKFPFPV